MSLSKQIDLEMDFAASVYLSEAPSHPRVFVLGWYSNFVGSESCQKQSVKLFAEYFAPTQLNIPPTASHAATHCRYILCFDFGKGGRGGRGKPQRRLEGQ